MINTRAAFEPIRELDLGNRLNRRDAAADWDVYEHDLRPISRAVRSNDCVQPLPKRTRALGWAYSE